MKRQPSDQHSNPNSSLIPYPLNPNLPSQADPAPKGYHNAGCQAGQPQIHALLAMPVQLLLADHDPVGQADMGCVVAGRVVKEKHF